MKLKDILSNDRGLGDTVKRAAEALGIEQSEDCKCKARQEKLNKLVPYHRTNAIAGEQYNARAADRRGVR